jgi:hypothetical protein
VNPTLGSAEGSNSHEVQLEVGFEGLFPGNSAINNFWFVAGTNNEGESAYLDDLVIGTEWGDVTAIPEPSTLALLGLTGLAAMLGLRRRKA